MSYFRMVDVLEEHFISRGETYPRVLARNIVKSALPARQRERLARAQVERERESVKRQFEAAS